MSEDLEQKKAAKREHPIAKVMGWLLTAACLLWLGWMARTLAPQKATEEPLAPVAMMGGQADRRRSKSRQLRRWR